MKEINKIFYIITIIVIIVSCKREKDLPIVQMPQFYKDMAPYTNNQLISFKGTNNDSFTVKVSITSKITTESRCLGCDPFQKVEIIEYTLRDTTATLLNDTFLTIRLISSSDNSFYFYIYPRIYQYDPARSAFASIYTYNNTATLNCSSNFGNLIMCIDSIVINNRTYYEVGKFYNTSSYPFILGDNKAKDFIYSKTKGLIQFSYEDGITYHLVE
ncbi:MAG: hypothetical protein U0T31_07570 [Chitinophagales bacterium]